MIKPPGCEGCLLAEKSFGFSKPEGGGANGVLLYGEALGHHEMIDSLPFRPQGAAGSLLAQAMRGVSAPRPAFLIDNVCKCQPPHDSLAGEKYEHGAIEHCLREYGDRTLADPRVKVILALGATAFRTLTGLDGKKLGIGDTRGYVIPNGRGYRAPVIGTYHPAFIRRGKLGFTDYLLHDLRKAIEVAAGRYRSYGEEAKAKLKYQEHPSQDDAVSFYHRVRDNEGLMLSVDIETGFSAETEEDERDDGDAASGEIQQIQFSLGKGEGIAFPWQGNYIKIAKAILGKGNVKIGHNFWAFDAPKLKASACKLEGIIHDSMWLFHHFKPDLEMGLQKVASMCDFPFHWKHLYSEALAWYGIADVDAPHWIYQKLVKVMKAQGVYEGYERHVLGLHPILVGAQDRGLYIDPVGRVELETMVTAKRDETYQSIQSKIPDELRTLQPPMGYVRMPPAAIDLLTQYQSLESRLERLRAAGKTVLDAEEFVTKRSYKRQIKEGEEHHLFSKLRIGRFELEDGEQVDRWVNVIDFNPVSSPQIIKYCKWQKHKVPVTLGDGKETTAKKEIERLAIATKDTFYDEIIRYREYNKLLTNDLPLWRPKADGACHTTFTFAPATGQLSSRAPNIQQCNKHSDLGNLFRRTIQARPGSKGRRRKLVELDYSGFHAVMLGREARCKKYMELAARDIHSFVGSYLVGKPIPYDLLVSNPDEFMERLKAFKSDKETGYIRDKQAKPAILGIGLGLGKRKLYWVNREHIKSEKAAGVIIDMIRELFPEIFIYQGEQVALADRQGYLKSLWGFIRWFFDARGEDAEKAMAFRMQNHAHGMLKEKIIELERLGALVRFLFINTIHDSLVFDPWEDEVHECIRIVQGVMEAPCVRLADPVVCPGGFSVRVEAMTGYNWAKGSKDNPEGMRLYEGEGMRLVA